jgi:hypothetical protein
MTSRGTVVIVVPTSVDLSVSQKFSGLISRVGASPDLHLFVRVMNIDFHADCEVLLGLMLFDVPATGSPERTITDVLSGTPHSLSI